MRNVAIDSAQSFKNGFSMARKDNKWGLLNRSGAWHTPPQYYTLERIDNSVFYAYRTTSAGKYGFLNQAGKVICEAVCDTFYATHKQFLTIKQNNKTRIIDTEGKKFARLPSIPPTLSAPVAEDLPAPKNLPTLEYDFVGTPKNGFRRIGVRYQRGVMDTKGNVLLQNVRYDAMLYWGRGIFMFRYNGAEGFWHIQRGWLWELPQ